MVLANEETISQQLHYPYPVYLKKKDKWIQT